MAPLLRSPLAGAGVDLCYPLLLNTSCRRTLQLRSTVLYVFFVAVALLIVLLNLLVIVAISHFRQLHTPTNLVLLSLACADLLVGLVVVPVDAQYFVTSCWLLGPWLCTGSFALSFTLNSASVASILLISLDRYVAVCLPLRYTGEVTMGRVQLAVGLCWSCSVLFNGSTVIVNARDQRRRSGCQGECVLVFGVVSVWVDLVIGFLAPLSVVVVLYLQVFAVALAQTRKMRWSRAAAGGTVVVRRSELKAAMTLGVVVVVFLACFFPAYVFTEQDTSDDRAAWFLAGWLLYLNSCLNPLLYACFYPWFRRAIRLIVTLQILKPNSSRAVLLH